MVIFSSSGRGQGLCVAWELDAFKIFMPDPTGKRMGGCTKANAAARLSSEPFSLVPLMRPGADGQWVES